MSIPSIHHVALALGSRYYTMLLFSLCANCLQGVNFEIYACNILDNGWDPYNNPQAVPFPYADGINAAVCTNGCI